MNYIAEIAKMLDVELGETFTIDGNEPLFAQLTDTGLVIMNPIDNAPMKTYGEILLSMILTGKVCIKRKPWRPKYGEDYYCVGEYGNIIKNRCENCWMDIMYYKVGNCYKTKDFASLNSDKWVSFYSSDEVLGV